MLAGDNENTSTMLKIGIISWATGLLRGHGFYGQLVRGGLGSIVVKTGQALLAFAVAVMWARILGPVGYGVYSFAFAILLLTIIPAQVGVPQLVVRETAKAQADDNYGLIRGLWRWGNKTVGGFSILVLGAASGVLLYLDIYGGGAQISTLAVGLALIPLIALANVRSACLSGLRKVVQSQLPEGIIRPVMLLLLVGCWIGWSGEDQLAPQQAMGLIVAASIISFLIGAWLLQRSLPQGLVMGPAPEYQKSVWRKAVIPLALISGLQLINNYVDLLIVGLFQPDNEIGIYRAVTQLSMFVIFGFQALNQVFQPYYALHSKCEDRAALQRLVTFSSRLIALTALPPLIIIFLFPQDIITLVFGAAYEGGWIVLVILSFGQAVNAFMGALGVLLNMMGYERVTMYWVAWAATVNIILTLIFVPLLGMEGAAIASTISLVFYNIVLFREVRLLLCVNTLPVSLSKKNMARGDH